MEKSKGYFVAKGETVYGYLCIDFDGSPPTIAWMANGVPRRPYVVVHRMALSDGARGKGISSTVFTLVEELRREKGVMAFRVDTDGDNQKMQHILRKNGFSYRGTIWFDTSVKIAFDKPIL